MRSPPAVERYAQGARLAVRADTVDPVDLAEALGTDRSNGLTKRVADERLHAHGRNELLPPRAEGVVRRLARHAVDPMALLLWAAAAISGLALGERLDAIAIISIVVLNVLIASVQEGKASRALQALREFEAPRATVIRDGIVHACDARDVVVGDLLVLQAGDRVPADARLVESAAMEADESLLTGESVPVHKDATVLASGEETTADRSAMVFAGTLVTRGSGRGVVAATGTGSQVGEIAGHLEQRVLRTPLQRDLRKVAITIGGLTIVIASAVVALLLFQTGVTAVSAERAFLVGVALAVAAVPEGLIAVTTVSLALGVKRMAERGGIIRRLASVETLGSTTVLAIDKTGTLTENRMRLRELVLADGTSLTPEAFSPELRERFADVAVLCSEATLHPATGDPLEIALLRAADVSSVADRRRERPRVAVLPFDSSRKRMTSAHRTDDGFIVCMKGAPEIVVIRCDHWFDAEGSIHHLTRGVDVTSMAERLASSGSRVLALASKPMADYADIEDAEVGMTLIGLALLEDPVRPEAAGAIRRARGAGVDVVMVTGDHPGTATSVARQVALTDEPDEVITGAQVRADGLPRDPMCVHVYARMDPEQKLDLVEALQRAGEVVAVTGDGVNDAPALRRADIGVALGRCGTDVAREAADLVVTDDNLATIVTAMREGRGIYANLRRVVDYLIACNLSEVMTVVLGLMFFPGIGVPLLPMQLLWMNLVTDGLPALALGMDPNAEDLMARPPRRRDEALLDRRRLRLLTGRASVLAVGALGSLAIERQVLDRPWAHARASMFTVLVVSQLLYAAGIGARRGARRVMLSPRLMGAVAVGIAAQVGIMSFSATREVFGAPAFSVTDWMLVGAMSAVSALALSVGARFRRQTSGGHPTTAYNPSEWSTTARGSGEKHERARTRFI